MALIICPGMHPVTWTQSFLAQLDQHPSTGAIARYVVPTDHVPAYSAYGVRRFLQASQLEQQPLVFLAFSAGCVAAAGASRYYLQQGYDVRAVIALDGWGVPLAGPFAVHRLSHDWFTHLTTPQPGTSEHFYADPAVPHADLWRLPQRVTGWRLTAQSPHRQRCAALPFLADCLATYLP